MKEIGVNGGRKEVNEKGNNKRRGGVNEGVKFAL